MSTVWFQVDLSDNSTYSGNDFCPMGYYCTNGTSYPTPCPIGTFFINLQVYQESDCQPCPRGKYCNQDAYTKQPAPPNCTEG